MDGDQRGDEADGVVVRRLARRLQREFVRDLASRLPRRIQLTTDGLRLYINAVDGAFGGEIDYAMLTKLYGPSGNDKSAETRYSPGASRAWKRRSSAGIPICGS